MNYQTIRFGSGPTPIVKRLLITLVASYILFALLARTNMGANLFAGLMLDPAATILKLQLWRLVTYAFIHSLENPFHMIFNAMLLFFIGPDLERRFGERGFVVFVLVTALGGAVFVCLSWLLGLSDAPVLGFSAVSLGLLVGFGLSFPDKMLLLFGVVPCTGRQLIWITVAIELLYAISFSDISSSAHFGGMASAAILKFGLWRPLKLKRYIAEIRWRVRIWLNRK